MSRLPKQPARASIAEDELPAYDAVIARLRQVDVADVAALDDHTVEGYYGALLNTPPIAAGIAATGRAIWLREVAGGFSHADHEWVDMVLSFDFGYYGFLPTHLPGALAAGVRLEAIDALRLGQEEHLDDDERFLAHYVRAVIGGTSTDEDYARLQQRLSERGAVEFTAFVMYLNLTIRLFQAFGVPNISSEEVEAILDELRQGAEVPTYESLRTQ